MKKYINAILISDTLIILANILLVIFLFDQTITLTVILLLLSVIQLLKNKKLFPIWLFSAVFGAFSEIIIIYFSGAWQYAVTDFINIPWWLFILWGMTGTYLVKVFLRLT